MPNSKQRIAKQKQRRVLLVRDHNDEKNLANAKTKTINEMFKDGSLPKELESRVTLRKGK